mmetsp:Transcript_65077/g.180975  ORF Transcript_65077/g.180975 Transcript_65077/m.180975 type:complete len:276 (+) Transcript_65077:606-1433(+)
MLLRLFCSCAGGGCSFGSPSACAVRSTCSFAPGYWASPSAETSSVASGRPRKRVLARKVPMERHQTTRGTAFLQLLLTSSSSNSGCNKSRWTRRNWANEMLSRLTPRRRSGSPWPPLAANSVFFMVGSRVSGAPRSVAVASKIVRTVSGGRWRNLSSTSIFCVMAFAHQAIASRQRCISACTFCFDGCATLPAGGRGRRPRDSLPLARGGGDDVRGDDGLCRAEVAGAPFSAPSAMLSTSPFPEDSRVVLRCGEGGHPSSALSSGGGTPPPKASP